MISTGRAVFCSTLLLPGLLLLSGAACPSSKPEAKPEAKAPTTASPAREPDVTTLGKGIVRFETPRGTWAIEVELARTEAQRARGLMFRSSLGVDRGMLFLFDESDEHSFWMHNTLIPLDMIFLDESRRVVGLVENAPPKTDKPRTVGKPSRYVLEVAGGEARVHGVGAGAQASFIDVPE